MNNRREALIEEVSAVVARPVPTFTPIDLAIEDVIDDLAIEAGIGREID